MGQSSQYDPSASSDGASAGSARLRRPPSAGSPRWIDYARFGERFVAHAVTPARIEAAVAGMAGRGITIGPFSIGPAGLAGFVAEGSVGKPHIVRSGPHVTFEVSLPVTMHITVTLGGQQLRLEAVVEIDLTLHARTADPLLVVIDIPRIRRRDISFVLRAQAIGSAVELLLDPIATLVQREVAGRVNAMLRDPAVVRARVFDVEALMNGERSPYRSATRFDWIGYDEFGRRFFPRIVTAARVREVAEGLSGRTIEVGPLRVGPRRMATVRVLGTVGTPVLTERHATASAEHPTGPHDDADPAAVPERPEDAELAPGPVAQTVAEARQEVREAQIAAPARVALAEQDGIDDWDETIDDAEEVDNVDNVTARASETRDSVEHRADDRHEPDDLVMFDLTVPVALDMSIAAVGTHRYDAEVRIPVALTARAADPLLIVIDVARPRARDITVDLRPRSRRARALATLGNIRAQIAIQVARVVAAELADPTMRTIDVGDRIALITD
ncbi:hypothetical protein [Nocardia alni]|uniref:hypothetical protein n=1 Tax=Nocardia alni TaxID=2815723 RepID=UPI001C240B8A|nr:hypothetical protein [Nocardia alni]